MYRGMENIYFGDQCKGINKRRGKQSTIRILNQVISRAGSEYQPCNSTGLGTHRKRGQCRGWSYGRWGIRPSRVAREQTRKPKSENIQNSWYSTLAVFISGKIAPDPMCLISGKVSMFWPRSPLYIKWFQDFKPFGPIFCMNLYSRTPISMNLWRKLQF